MSAIKRWGWVGLVAAALWACGESPALPTPDGGCTGADCDQNPPPGDDPTPETTTWPLTTGSTWKYRITDEFKGVFDKQVEVLGEAPVPGLGVTATRVRSEQLERIELSYQTIVNGVVMRLREEDSTRLTSGEEQPASVATWGAAGTVKSIGALREVGWGFSSTVQERVEFADGSPDDVKEKTYAWRVVAVDEEVTVPAGTFRAMKIVRERTDADKQDRTYWLVPGVGKVKETGERTEELVEYDVK